MMETHLMEDLNNSDDDKKTSKRHKISSKRDIPEEKKDSSNDEAEEYLVSSDNEIADKNEAHWSDSYTKHFEYTLPITHIPEKLSYQPPKSFEDPELKQILYCHPTDFPHEVEPNLERQSISEFHLKENLQKRFSIKEPSSFQLGFLNLISDYHDVTYMQRTPTKGKALRKMYILHILNHILKSRAKIIHHNSKLSKNPEEEFRDQGFTRPSTLILVPFRNDCFHIVQDIISLLPECVVMNKKRFEKEFGPPPKRQRYRKRPQDFEDMFEGNTDEDFKIGLKIVNKSVTLYSEFYKSDLIIASPLGLRPIIGAEGDRNRDFDFLSSIEILVLDRLDVLYLQNLVHLLHFFRHLNLLPKDGHDCNFFRVRMYALDGMAKFYRQTIFVSSIEHHWFESTLLQNFCFNYKGYLSSVTKLKTPKINQVLDTVKMCFRLFEFKDPAQEFEDRFNFFINKVLPDFKNPEMAQTLVFIPSYFDFVRLRNYFREQELSVTMICEYLSPGKVAEARNNFFKERRHFLLYTERAHFYNRFTLKGVQHVLFYQPPTYPVFFTEMNFAFLDSIPRRKDEEKSCTVIASKLDALQLKHILGITETKRMLASENKLFVKYIQG